MKIGLCGAQGTGKTTLARALARELGLPLIEEQARLAAKELGIESPRALKGQPELGRRFQWRCLELQLAAESMPPGGFVSDRTVLDNAVYWMKWHAQGAESEENMCYYRIVEKHAKNYDLVVYVPPEIPLEDDGFRSVNLDYQREIDFLIRLFLFGLNIRAWVTVGGPLEKRVKQVLTAVRS